MIGVMLVAGKEGRVPSSSQGKMLLLAGALNEALEAVKGWEFHTRLEVDKRVAVEPQTSGRGRSPISERVKLGDAPAAGGDYVTLAAITACFAG